MENEKWTQQTKSSVIASVAQVQHQGLSAASKEARGDEKKLNEFTQGRDAFARGPHLSQPVVRASLYAGKTPVNYERQSRSITSKLLSSGTRTNRPRNRETTTCHGVKRETNRKVRRKVETHERKYGVWTGARRR